MKQQKSKQVFRHAVSGYNKQDVNSYILSLDHRAQDGLLETRRTMQQTEASLRATLERTEAALQAATAEIGRLNRLVETLRAEKQETEATARQQLLASAQIVSELAELRRKLTAEEQAAKAPLLPEPVKAAPAPGEDGQRRTEEATAARCACPGARPLRPVLRRIRLTGKD